MKLVLKVEGMHCEGCENRIKNALSTINNVNKIEANHETKEVIVEYSDEINVKEVKDTLEDLGFEVKNEK